MGHKFAKCQVCVGNGKWSDQSGVKYTYKGEVRNEFVSIE